MIISPLVKSFQLSKDIPRARCFLQCKYCHTKCQLTWIMDSKLSEFLNIFQLSPQSGCDLLKAGGGGVRSRARIQFSCLPVQCCFCYMVTTHLLERNQNAVRSNLKGSRIQRYKGSQVSTNFAVVKILNSISLFYCHCEITTLLVYLDKVFSCTK